MIGLTLTNHQKQLQSTARKFAEEMIAGMAIKVHAARLLTLQAATLVDRREGSSVVSAYAKALAADYAMQVTTDAVQVFGGYGYSKE